MVPRRRLELPRP